MRKPLQYIDVYRARIAWLWIGFLLLVFGYSIYRLQAGVHFESNILSLLPNEHAFPMQEEIDRQAGSQIENSVLYLVEVGNEEYERRFEAFLHTLKLQQSTNALKIYTADTAKENFNRLNQKLSEYRYNFLLNDEKDLLLQGKTEVLVEQAVQQLYSPIPSSRYLSFNEDPLFIYSRWINSIFAAENGAAMMALNQHGTSYGVDNKFYRLVVLEFQGNAFSSARQEKILALLDEAEKPFRNSGQEILRAGLLFHAVAGATQAKREMSTIGLGSLVAVVLLFLWAYRSFKPLLLTLLALAIGCFSALSICLILFDSVHLITLAFGASLVGVSVDYCFHFFSARQHAGQGRKAIVMIAPAILMGLVSSVLAYGAQLLTPFPGLRQMAVFSVVGLASVWLTVVLVMPFFFKRSTEPLANARLSIMGSSSLNLSNSALKCIFIAISSIVIVMAVFALPQLEFDDDIRLLTTSPDSLIGEEQKVRRITGISGGGTYFAVIADSEETLMQKESLLCDALGEMKSKRWLKSFQCLSSLIPPTQTQRNNYALQSRYVYGEESVKKGVDEVNKGAIEQLAVLLGVESNSLQSARDKFSSAPSPQSRILTVAEVAPYLGFTPFDHLYLGLVKNDRQEAFVSLVKVELASELPQGLLRRDVSHMLSLLPQKEQLDQYAFFVDKVGFISSLLKNYREKMLYIACFAYAGVLLLFFWRYKSAAFRVIAPVTLSAILVASLLAMCGVPLNLFCVLGFMLLLGVGLDIGIFLQESNGERHALQAVSLSAITTLCAFGFLSLSNTPVLYSFGIIVLPGIALSWGLAWLFFSSASHVNKQKYQTDHI